MATDPVQRFRSVTTFSPPPLINPQDQLSIGMLLFDKVDQMDVTGPYEVFCRVPGVSIELVAANLEAVSDAHGLILQPTCTLGECPPLDLLVLPGGSGVDALFDDKEILGFISERSAQAKLTMTVCTGSLLAGCAGLLAGKHATTHWASHHLLERFGAIAVNSRVVIDGALISTAGVSAGFDGSLEVAALFCGAETAKAIQLHIEYNPEPPFVGGTPEKTEPAVLERARAEVRPAIERRSERLKALGR